VYAHRPGAQIIAVVNIVLGVLGGLGWLALVLAGGFLTGLGISFLPAAGVVAGGFAALGGLLTLFGLAFVVLHVMLVAGGVGILKGSPSGRSLSLTFAWVTLVLGLIQLVVSGFTSLPCNAVDFIYSIVLLVVLNQTDWK
jgi:hypothetical protein